MISPLLSQKSPEISAKLSSSFSEKYLQTLNVLKFFQNLFIVYISEHFLGGFEKLYQNLPSF